jgi:hypothetical protein
LITFETGINAKRACWFEQQALFMIMPYTVYIQTQRTSLFGNNVGPPPEGESAICVYVHFLLCFDGAKINYFIEMKTFFLIFFYD